MIQFQQLALLMRLFIAKNSLFAVRQPLDALRFVLIANLRIKSLLTITPSKFAELLLFSSENVRPAKDLNNMSSIFPIKQLYLRKNLKFEA